MKTLACVPPLIYHSLVTSMQIGKQKETSPAHHPLLCIRCQLPDVWGEQLHQQGEMKQSWQEKRAKIEAYPPSGISFVSFLPFSFLTLCCPPWWEEGVNGGHTATAAATPSLPSTMPIWTKKGWGCFPGGHRGCPNINYTFVHLWLTLGWPWLTSEWKRSSKTSPPPVAYSLLPTDCTWAINPLSTKWNFCLNEAIMSSSSQTAESNEDPDYSFHGLGCSEDR